MLQRRGYQIIAAQGGAQALSKAEAEQPDLVILDVMMPDMDGYEVTRRMRANAKTAHIPIIMFTAKTLVGEKVAGVPGGRGPSLNEANSPGGTGFPQGPGITRWRPQEGPDGRPHARTHR